MALSGYGKRHISPQLYAGTCGQARRPLRHPGGGYSGRLHPVSAPGRRSLSPQIPGGKRLEPSAACRPRKGQPDKHPLLGKRTKDHQSEVLLPSDGKPWFRFSIYASHVRYGNFSPAKQKARLQATICGSADGLSLWNHSVSIILIFALTYMAFRKTRSRSSNVAFHAGCSENTVCST